MLLAELPGGSMTRRSRNAENPRRAEEVTEAHPTQPERDDTFVRHALVVTISGSTYAVAQCSHGYWWVFGVNAPNAHSRRLPARWYRIAPVGPWPPSLGACLHLKAVTLPSESEHRMPGGGKVTSIVVGVREGDEAVMRAFRVDVAQRRAKMN